MIVSKKRKPTRKEKYLNTLIKKHKNINLQKKGAQWILYKDFKCQDKIKSSKTIIGLLR